MDPKSSNHMTPEELIQKYPRLFPEGKCLCGIDINDGWMPIVDKLCNDICEYCNTAKILPPIVDQIKQKFAGLRFYTTPRENCGFSDADEKKIDNLISDAESTARKTCEFCGDIGKPQTIRGWMFIICEACNETRINNHS